MLISAVAGLALGSWGQSVTVPELNREFRGVWVATVDNIDYPSKPGLSTAAMRAELLAILDKCQDLGLNAVVFQVRPSADALYQSAIEPWSYYLTGEQGKGPTGGFDPLAFAIEEAHKRGIELHAWCNPYRALHPAQKGPLHASHLAKTDPEIVKTYGTYLWMDPGERAVQERSFAVFMDLVERYDLDGLHIDDYFYPYPVTANGAKVEFPDESSYRRYREAGGTLGRKDWRRKNVDDFIQRVYKGIKERKPTVKFGISPFGIYRPGVPEGIRAGIDQYDELYADALRWYREGWLDYWTPQLYWPIAQTPQAYPVLLDYWAGQNAKGRHYWPGNFTSRTNPGDGNWKASEVVEQIRLTRLNKVSTGNVHFSYKALRDNYNGIADALKKEVYGSAALVPASPWLDAGKPGRPTFTVSPSGGRLTVKVSSAGAEDVRFYVVQTSTGAVSVSSLEEVTVPSAGVVWVSMRVFDKAGNMSDATVTRVGGQ